MGLDGDIYVAREREVDHNYTRSGRGEGNGNESLLQVGHIRRVLHVHTLYIHTLYIHTYIHYVQLTS